MAIKYNSVLTVLMVLFFPISLYAEFSAPEVVADFEMVPDEHALHYGPPEKKNADPRKSIVYSYADTYSWYSTSFAVIDDSIIIANDVTSKLILIRDGFIVREKDVPKNNSGIYIRKALPRLDEFFLSRNYSYLYGSIKDFAFYNTSLELVQTKKDWPSCSNIEVIEDGILCLNPPSSGKSLLLGFDGATVKDYDLAGTAPKGKKARYNHPFWFYRENGQNKLYYQGDEITLPDPKEYRTSTPGNWHYREAVDKSGTLQKLFIYQDCGDDDCRFTVFDLNGKIISRDNSKIRGIDYGKYRESYLSYDMGFYVMYVTDGEFPQGSLCPGPDCDVGPFPDKMRIVRWQWNPPNDSKIRRPEPIRRTPDPKARFTTEKEAEQERKISRRLIKTGGDPSLAPTKQMADIVSKGQIRLATYKPTKVRQIALENIRKKKEAAFKAEQEAKQKAERKKWLYIAGILALLSAVIVSVIVIRRRGR